MKKNLFALALAFIVLAIGCKKSSPDDEEITPITGVVEISGDIASVATWTADKIYLLKGNVYVTGNATLTIEPGTIIKGDKATKGSLIITRGAKISAIGTVDKPIVFTSSQAAGARAQGDWGGVILLGKAPVNAGTNVAIEGISDVTDKAKYGGTDVADNSGTVKYVRIEFAGIPLTPDNEINGLTFGGVGSGTTIDYVEVYRSGDDSFEWFGGTVNAKHLLSIGAWDDDFDTDFGYSGKIQFGLAQRAQVVADFSGSNGFESDNDGNGSALTPKTSPVFSNMTIVGPLLSVTSTSNINANFQHGAQVRRNSSMSLFNSIVANYTEGIYIDDTMPTAASLLSTANYTAGTLVIKNNLIYGCNVKSNEIKGVNPTSKALFEAGLRADNLFNPALSITDLLTDPLKYGLDFKAATNANAGIPNFTLKAGSLASTGALFTDVKLTTGFEAVAYKGAFGTTDWTSGWANFDPQTLLYTTPGAVK